jgi:hypothetical protein
MQREPRTFDHLIRNGVRRHQCDGVPLTNIEMLRVCDGLRAERNHVRDHGECSHGCSDDERTEFKGRTVCRWTGRPCVKVELAELLQRFAILTMGDDDNGDNVNQGERTG